MRLIVVDAFEITERHKHVEYYGRDASRFTTDLRKDKRTRLEIQTGPTSQDRYGRLLAFFVQSRSSSATC
ncbi:MAG: thermonuclease family protein [Isosphaeraceae bacterium]